MILVGILVIIFLTIYLETFFTQSDSSAFDNFHNFDERAEMLKEYKAALEAQQIAHREHDNFFKGLESVIFTNDPDIHLKINSVCDKMSNADCAVKSLEGALVRGTRNKATATHG